MLRKASVATEIQQDRELFNILNKEERELAARALREYAENERYVEISPIRTPERRAHATKNIIAAEQLANRLCPIKE
jgi:hypothetical protein